MTFTIHYFTIYRLTAYPHNFIIDLFTFAFIPACGRQALSFCPVLKSQNLRNL